LFAFLFYIFAKKGRFSSARSSNRQQNKANHNGLSLVLSLHLYSSVGLSQPKYF
jgi:hypothetical protein